MTYHPERVSATYPTYIAKIECHISPRESATETEGVCVQHIIQRERDCNMSPRERDRESAPQIIKGVRDCHRKRGRERYKSERESHSPKR